MKEQFYCETVKHQEYGEIIVLKSEDRESGKTQKIYLTPDYGFNLAKYEVDGEDLIYTMPDVLRKEGFSGIPILYPTPNRVRDAQFRFKGQSYLQQKKGESRYLHGLVYDEKWTAGRPLLTEQGAQVSAWIDFEEDNIGFQSFPWKHRLTVTWKLKSSGIRLEYEVHNQDEKELPYGFAIHPYFPVKAYGETAAVCVPAKKMFESTQERFPTGNILDITGTEYDLCKSRKVTELKLDDVYTGLGKTESQIFYGSRRLILSASEEFNHMVVYTPEMDFFCLENQTCMTDAHNFYDKGYKNSGIILVRPGGVRSGWIELDSTRTGIFNEK